MSKKEKLIGVELSDLEACNICEHNKVQFGKSHTIKLRKCSVCLITFIKKVYRKFYKKEII